MTSPGQGDLDGSRSDESSSSGRQGPWARRLGWLVVLGIFGIIGSRLRSSWSELAAQDLMFEWAPLVLSMALLAGWMGIQALAWQRLTLLLKVAIPRGEGVSAWFYSQLGKYVPGKVFIYLGRLHFYRSAGRSAGRFSVAFGVEMVATLASASITGLLALLVADLSELSRYRPFLVVGLAVMMVVLHPRLLNGLVGALARVLRRPPLPIEVSYRRLLSFVALYTVNYFLLGVAFFFMIRAIHQVPANQIPFLAGAFAIAALVGVLALFAPAGMGVREGILAALLSLVVATPVALIIALAARVWFTVVELGLIAIAFVAVRART